MNSDNRKFELHVWGPESKSFDPNCLAAIWYLGLVAKNETVVVPSSNTWIDPNCQLPALLHEGKAVAGGFLSIVRYLKSLDSEYDLDYTLDKSAQRDVVALTSYIDSNVSVLSLYTLFLHRQNYEEYTRPLFSELLPFPMQYNAAMKQCELARIQCSRSGLDQQELEDDLQSEQLQQQQPSLGDIHQQLESKRQQHQKLVNETRENLKALNFGQKVYSTLQTMDWPPSINTADVLLLAHLSVQLDGRLTAALMRPLIQSQFSALFGFYNDRIEHLEKLKIETRRATGRQVPNLSNAVLQSLGF